MVGVGRACNSWASQAAGAGECVWLLAQVDIPPNPSWVPWPKRAGRNSLGILGVLRHPASSPAGSWQGSLLDTWLDATLHTPSGEGEVPESTGGTCEGRVFFQGRQSSYKQWFFV